MVPFLPVLKLCEKQWGNCSREEWDPMVLRGDVTWYRRVLGTWEDRWLRGLWGAWWLVGSHGGPAGVPVKIKFGVFCRILWFLVTFLLNWWKLTAKVETTRFWGAIWHIICQYVLSLTATHEHSASVYAGKVTSHVCTVCAFQIITESIKDCSSWI